MTDMGSTIKRQRSRAKTPPNAGKTLFPRDASLPQKRNARELTHTKLATDLRMVWSLRTVRVATIKNLNVRSPGPPQSLASACPFLQTCRGHFDHDWFRQQGRIRHGKGDKRSGKYSNGSGCGRSWLDGGGWSSFSNRHFCDM